MARTPVLEMKNIGKSFPGVRALDDICFDLYPGEVHALVGENGAGKSTLMNVLSGMFGADEGEILVRGHAVRIATISDALKLGISMIHQELMYVPALTVAENIFLGKEDSWVVPGWINERSIARKAQQFLDDMQVDIDANARMSTLSVAKQQMVEIAKAVTNQASILIMDEPTSAITQQEIRTLFEIIDQLKAKGVAVVYISHKLDEVFEIADRITVQRDGRTVATTDANQTNENEVITRMVGREVSDLYPKVDAVVGDELLRVEHLSGPGYQDVSFTLRRGEILGFSGLMGSGRTEIMRGIYGMDKTTEGEIYLKGTRIQVRSPQDAIRAGIGLVSEDRKNEGLVLQMSVRENVTLAALERCCRNRILSKRIEADFTAREIKRFNIKTSSQSRAVATLSGGNQQKVVLGKTLLNEPDVLILDEPTRGIDVGAKAEIYRFISTLASQGKGILMVSSEMPEVLGMSDRVIVIHEGRKRGELERSDATQESIMRLALSTPSESVY